MSTMTSITERNANSPSVDSHRNGVMTNAERQRRYRDRQRGGPAVGRWHGHVAAAMTAKTYSISRSMVFMSKWLLSYAPELVPDLDAGKLKITPTYRRVRRDRELAYFRALIAERDQAGEPSGGKEGTT